MIFLAIGLVIAAVLLATPRNRANLIYALAPINALADSMVVGEASNAGLTRLPLMFAIALVYLPKLRVDALNTLVGAFLLYLLLLIPFSSDPFASFQIYSKVALCVVLLPIARHVVVNAQEMSKLRASILIALVMYSVNFVIAQVFEIGTRPYATSAFYVAGGGVYLTYSMAYGLLFAPMTMQHANRVNQILMGLLYAFCGLVVLMTFRRGAIVAVAVGYFVFFIFSRPRQSRPLVTLGLTLTVLALCFAPFYAKQLVRLYEVRVLQGVQTEVNGVGRYKETQVVYEELVDGSLTRMLFGTEPFNSVSYFRWWHGGRGRGLHVDTNILLHGTGIIGVGLYLLILLQLAIQFVTCPSTRVFRSDDFLLYRATALAILPAGFVLSLTGQLWSVTPYALFWLTLGALYGVTSHSSTTAPMVTTSTAPVLQGAAT